MVIRPKLGCWLVLVGMATGCMTPSRLARRDPPPAVNEPASKDDVQQAEERTPAEESATVVQQDQQGGLSLEPGYALEAEGQLAEAQVFYGRVLRVEPANSEALHRLAVIATLRDDSAAASSFYQRALDLDPQNAGLLTDAGYFQYLQQDYDGAAPLLEQAVALSPQDPRALSNLGLVYGMQGRVDDALTCFHRSQPAAEALQSLAYIHQQRQEWQLALACYREAHSVDPGVEVPPELTAQVLALREKTRTAGLPTAATLPASEAEVAALAIEESLRLPPESPVIEPVDHQWPQGAFVDSAAEVAEEAGTLANAWGLPVARPYDPEIEGAFSQDDDQAEERPPVASSPTPEWQHPQWSREQRSDLAARVPDRGFRQYCPVTLRDRGELVDGRPEFAIEHRGQFYELASADALRKFREDPLRYTPVANGLDVVAVRRGEMQLQGSLDHAVWHHGRLFLFTSAEHLAEFRTNPAKFIDVASP